LAAAVLVVAVAGLALSIPVVVVGGGAMTVFRAILLTARSCRREFDVLDGIAAVGGGFAGLYERRDDLGFLESLGVDAGGACDLSKLSNRFALELGPGAHVLLSGRHDGDVNGVARLVDERIRESPGKRGYRIRPVGDSMCEMIANGSARATPASEARRTGHLPQ
jgi:hypothetical protein